MAQWKRIVVGVDGSEYSRTALRWACEEAEACGAELLVVTVWAQPPPVIASPLGSYPWGADLNLDEAAEALLEDTLKAAFPTDRPPYLQTQVSEGQAAKVLIDLSKDADLVVVGSRGHGAFTGMLLGSVSQHVAAQAACSVIILR